MTTNPPTPVSRRKANWITASALAIGAGVVLATAACGTADGVGEITGNTEAPPTTITETMRVYQEVDPVVVTTTVWQNYDAWTTTVTPTVTVTVTP